MAESSTHAKKLDINTASAQEMADAILMLGKERAEAIVRHRELHGPYKSLEELRTMAGFNQKLSTGLQDFLTIGEDEGSHKKKKE